MLRMLRWSTAVVAIALATLAGCLSATPPKTPNQRAVERAAPRVTPPPVPDADRRPVPYGG
jgi:hypothetical protein